MDWHAVAGVVSGILAISTLFPYLWSIFYGTTRPSIISQSLWCFTALLVVAGQYASEGWSWSMAVALGTAFNNIIIIAVCLFGYGYLGHTKIDFVSGLLALIGVVLWQLTDMPFYGILFAILASICAGFPTYHKTFKHPETESVFAWSILIVSGFLSLIAARALTFASIIFPIFTVLEASLVVALTLRKSKMPV
jgi:hypothetical protein